MQCHLPTISSAAADRFHAGGMPLTSLGWRPMGATLARSAAIGQQAIAISGPAARRGGPGAGRCAGGMGTQATHAHLHGIECVERLGLNPLMRALVWLLVWLPAKMAEWLNMVPSR